MGGRTQKTEFLFVNKDPKSGKLSRSGAEEKALILSHVQTRRRNAARLKAGKAPWLQFASSMRLDEEPLPWKTGREAVQLTTVSPSELESLTPQFRLPLNYPKGNSSDPFHCTVAGQVDRIHSVLQQGLGSMSPLVFSANAFAPRAIAASRMTSRHEARMAARLQVCVDNEMLMYSTLTVCLGSMQWLTDGTVDVDASPEYFMSKALAAIRSHLSTPGRKVDSWLLLSVYSLALSESWQSHPNLPRKDGKRTPDEHRKALQNSHVHFSALMKLVQEAGGLSNLEPYVLESILLGDKYTAFSGDNMPFSTLEWNPGPVPPMQGTYSPQSQADFEARTGQSKLLLLPLQPELLAIVQSTASFTKIACSLWKDLDVTERHEQWMFLRLQYLEHSLLHLRGVPLLDECVKRALLCLLLNATEYSGAQSSAIKMQSTLQQAIVKANIAGLLPSVDPSLLFWCLCVGGCIVMPIDERDWYIEELANLILSGDVSVLPSFDSFRDELESYLFVTDRSQEQLHNLVTAVHARISTSLAVAD